MDGTSMAAAHVSGAAALLGKPLENPEVFVASIDQNDNIDEISDKIQVDKDGNYTLRDYIDGDYYVIAFRNVNNNDAIDAGDYYGVSEKFNFKTQNYYSHFLVPVEFLDRFLNLNVESRGGLTMPDEYDRDQSRNNLRLRVYLNDDEFNRNEELEVIIEVLNIDNNTQTLSFNSAHKYNIYVKNRFGRVLYSWADGKIFSQVVHFQSRKLQSGAASTKKISSVKENLVIIWLNSLFYPLKSRK